MNTIIHVSSLLLFIFLTIGCTTHDLSQVKDNGEWVSIYNAPLTCGYILHNNKIYGVIIDAEELYDEKTFWAKYIDEILLMDNVDINTFEINIINDYDQPYAKDKNKVYCPIDTELYEWDESDKTPFSTIYTGTIVIPGADPKTFKYLGNGYAVDKRHMYWRGEKIKWNDSIINIYNKY